MNDAIDLALCLVWYASFDAAVDVWSENLAKQPYLPNVTLNQSFAHSGFWSPWFCIWRWIIFWKGSANGVLQFLWYVQVFQYFPSVVCILQSIWSECYTLSRQFSFLLGRRVRRVMWCCYSISWTCRRSWAYLWLMKKKGGPGNNPHLWGYWIEHSVGSLQIARRKMAAFAGSNMGMLG